MHFEYLMLSVMTFIFLLAWAPSSLAKLKTFGPKWLASNRDPIQNKSLSGWGSRVERAHNNLKDNYPAFAVTVLILGQLNKFDDLTYWLTLLYVLARIIHFIAYGLGNVPVRFLAYLTGLICNVWLLIKIII